VGPKSGLDAVAKKNILPPAHRQFSSPTFMIYLTTLLVAHPILRRMVNKELETIPLEFQIQAFDRTN
jgi:hypothetical protein